MRNYSIFTVLETRNFFCILGEPKMNLMKKSILSLLLLRCLLVFGGVYAQSNQGSHSVNLTGSSILLVN
jgi:hypothetical protein